MNMEISDEDKKVIIEEAGKHLVWELLDSHKELENMSSYIRLFIRKGDCSLLRKAPSKELIIKYSIPYNNGYTSVAWWLFEQWEKGNITIKDDVQPKP
jgi:hypothetical protein